MSDASSADARVQIAAELEQIANSLTHDPGCPAIADDESDYEHLYDAGICVCNIRKSVAVLREAAAALRLEPATLETFLEINGPQPTPLRVAGFLRQYAGMIRKNERWDIPETMAGAYESAALQLELYHARLLRVERPQEESLPQNDYAKRLIVEDRLSRGGKPEIRGDGDLPHRNDGDS